MKVDYGVDAPGVVWTLFAVSVVGLIAGILLRVFPVLSAIAFVGGGVMFLLFLSMAGYVMGGKLRFRDYMIGLVPWTGTETVLDIGTGRGLLLIAAAKKLSTGRAIGTDIWSAKDLSGNSPENTLLNARLEQMSDRVEVLTEDARKLSFASESIDVVLSLHPQH